MGPEVVAAATIGSMALDAGGSILKGHGEAAGQDFMAARDRRSAELGRIKANQTDTALRDELNTTLNMIDVTRAAAGTDPLSPTAIAIKDNEARISDRTRTAKVASIKAQAAEDMASADYRDLASRYALLGGYVGASAKALKGLGRGSYG